MDSEEAFHLRDGVDRKELLVIRKLIFHSQNQAQVQFSTSISSVLQFGEGILDIWGFLNRPMKQFHKQT